MTDMELLELAAKAASIYLDWDAPGDPIARDGDEWNPLTDDGDALRLAHKLSIEVSPIQKSRSTHTIYGSHNDVRSFVERWPDSGDGLECTRRAIVRAAAEIGEAMP
ncbi:hypothetical protein QN399_00990 [Pseudomonas sp. 10C3]|uniref:hypothetical protein n=1 Tax=Pseudomonas sp. 10C3 TaxID=3118753 RepID=UPI002E817E8B|nr:hypothetical protein [Pseudomonas sp. 10C3]MEE3504851.1 hypothetical protein [Pseudomonas sp. 10C3]